VKSANIVKLGVDEALVASGFSRRGSLWYRHLSETILIVDVQKSPFDEQHYVNAAVFVKALSQTNPMKIPREYQCHIRTRLETLRSTDTALLEILHLDNHAVDDFERRRLVMNAVRESVVPFLVRCSTVDGIREAYREGLLHNMFVHLVVRELIGPSGSRPPTALPG
jgi:hypothetical protein